jgi:cephalosporin-C deacetylase-like acetyl esterase
MDTFSRRTFLGVGLAASAGLLKAANARAANVHEQLLELAARQEKDRRARFAAVKSSADLEALQKNLRESFLRLLDGLPASNGPPPARVTGTIDADGYRVEKLVYESFPGYFVPAVLYVPKSAGPMPGVISPCGHSTNGKAAGAYQTLHVNLAKRGFVVLSYDPVGQGERSQFWVASRGRSRFNLSCGEHAVLGNPLYLLGTSLARYRIFDGIRAIDYLTSRPEVDAKRIGCVGNSGGGTLTAYIAALDPRVTVAASCCYITTLPRRMGNRIQTDPDSDPEQDIFGFVSEGIDHAGLLALQVPRPTLVGSAQRDFFPIEGARESFAEAKRLYEVAGVPERVAQAESPERHGLTLPLRKAVYAWFERWLTDRKVTDPVAEIRVTPRSDKELQVSPDGQVNLSFKSRPLLPLAWQHFTDRKRSERRPLRDLLRPDPEFADYRLTELSQGHERADTLVVCVNGNESRAWPEEKDFVQALAARGDKVVAIDLRGVGPLRPELAVRNHEYTDALCGVEENIAYNAFLVGKSLLGMRVADVSEALKKLTSTARPSRIVVCGRADAALVALLAAAVEKAITHVAVEGVPLSFVPLFDAGGRPINAASILPGLLRDFGDVPEILDAIAPRKVLASPGVGRRQRPIASVTTTERGFVGSPDVLLDWMGGSS